MNKHFDSILKFLDSEEWYVNYNSICEKFDIAESKRKYVLSKLESEGNIDILSSKDSLDIKISDEGRVFIHESGYSHEKEIEVKGIGSRRSEKRHDIFLKTATLLLTIITVFLGCKRMQKDSIIQKKNERIEILEKQNMQIDKTIEEFHFFSSIESKDRFKLHLAGKDIINSIVEFEIISTTGETIFSHEFKSLDLIGYG